MFAFSNHTEKVELYFSSFSLNHQKFVLTGSEHSLETAGNENPAARNVESKACATTAATAPGTFDAEPDPGD